MYKKKALSFSRFIKRFSNEEACVKYLYAIKWSKDFARRRIAFASTVQTDGFNAYRKPLAERCNHEWEVFNPDGELLKWLHHMIGNVKTFINGTYQYQAPVKVSHRVLLSLQPQKNGW